MSRETRAAQVPTRLAGSSLEACAPRAKSQLPRLADAPLSPDTPQSAPAKGQGPVRQPGQQRAEHHLRQREREVRDATDHHERRASQGCRCVTSLNTRDGPVFPRPRALPRAFRAKRLGSRATRLGKHARPTTLSPTSSFRLPVPAPTSRARPEPASRPRPHPSFRTRVVVAEKLPRKPTDRNQNRRTGHGDRVAASPFATDADAPPRPFADSPRLQKNKNSKFDVGCAKVGAGGFDAEKSRFDYETSQAVAAQMKARQLGGAGSFLSHDH